MHFVCRKIQEIKIIQARVGKYLILEKESF